MNALTIGASKIHQIDGLYSLNDLHKAAGDEAKYRPAYFLSNEQTKSLIEEISKAGIPAIKAKQGVGTYACRELVIAYAAWISPSFHLKVIRVFLEAISPPISPRLVQIPPEGKRFLVVFDGHGHPKILDAEGRCLVDGHDLANLQTFLREFVPVAHLGPALDIIGQRAVRALASKRAGLW